MKNRITDISLRQAAIIAGTALLIMTILAVFAEFFVRQNLIVPGDAETTAKNILSNELLFRIAVCSYLIVAILDVIVAWALYVFLRPVNKSLSLLTAWLRVVYAVILAIVLVNFIIALHLLSKANYLSVFETKQLHAHAMLFLNAFDLGWSIGIIIFGFHLFILGYLFLKVPGYITKILGILVMIAGLGYIIDNFIILITPSYSTNIAMFTFIGEVLLIIWLLIKGIRLPHRLTVEV